MIAILSNLLTATFNSSLVPVVLVRYLMTMAGILVLAWPISDIVGRQSAPQTFAVLAFCQVLSIPFIVNSFVTGRFELEDRINIEDWLSYTPVSPAVIACAHFIWSTLLALVFYISSLPLTLVALPLSGHTLANLLVLTGVVLAISGVSSTFAYIVSSISTADWVTSSAVDACIGMWILMTVDGVQSDIATSTKMTPSFLAQFASPAKAVWTAINRTHGIPWEIVSPLFVATVLALIGCLVGAIVRFQGRGANVR